MSARDKLLVYGRKVPFSGHFLNKVAFGGFVKKTACGIQNFFTWSLVFPTKLLRPYALKTDILILYISKSYNKGTILGLIR